MSDSFNTNVANWQGVDDELVIGSDNLTKSGVVAQTFNDLKEDINIRTEDLPILDGFITQHGSVFVKSEVYYSKNIKLTCKEGDIFFYKGLSLANAFACRFFDDNGNTLYTKIGTTYNLEEVFFTPINAVRVIFQSIEVPSLGEIPFKISCNRWGKDIEEKIDRFFSYDNTISMSGYYTDKGTYYNGQTVVVSKVINFPVIAGEIYHYKGYSTGNAMSYCFYDISGNIVGDIVKGTDLNNYVKVTVPNNAVVMRAQSIAFSPNIPEIEVIKDNYLFNDTNTLKKSKTKYDSILLGNINITEVDGFYTPSGSFISSEQIHSKKMTLPVVENEKYFYHGLSFGSAFGYRVLNSNGEVIESYIQSQYGDFEPILKLITIPLGGVILEVQSINKTENEIQLGFYPYDFKDELEKRGYGKRIVILGDSITSMGIYTSAMERGCGCYIYNRGQSATTVTYQGGVGMSARIDLTENNDKNANTAGLPSPSNIDIAILFGGSNDWIKANVPIGTINDAPASSSNATFYASLKYIAKKYIEIYTGKRLVFFTLLPNLGATSATAAYTINNDGTITEIVKTIDNVNVTREDYNNAIRSVAKLYGIEVIELDGVGFIPETQTLADLYYVNGDGLHPNAKGGKLMGEYILRKLFG